MVIITKERLIKPRGNGAEIAISRKYLGKLGIGIILEDENELKKLKNDLINLGYELEV
ncbi:DUF2080 family transposase-associated protein [Methanococcus voltae]|uniref:Uncharacterized protein n=1 Tax=Methanococcus voltae (strain ATCC BAA-1334 / A3) TaxID=456320 RepID=D7DSM6_METV3|nr:DUF2080 family transposase-associated protein [Methanococcus voltae]MCS3901735.1 putative transposon-encoded protein [Methanococcus voltae]